MANEERISEYIDRTGVQQDTEFMLKNLNEIITAYNKLSSLRVGLNGINEMGKVASTTQQVSSSLDVYEKAVQRVTERTAQLNGQNKEFTQTLLNDAKAAKESAAAKLNEAKAITETESAKLNEAKASKETSAAKLNEIKAEKELSQAKLNEAKIITETAKAKKIESDAAAKVTAAEEKQAKKAAELNEPYKQLVIRFNAAAREAKNLAAQYGALDPRAQAAAKSALALNNQLKTIDASVGQHQRDVGNYGKAWDGVRGKIKEVGNIILGFVGITAGIRFFESSIDQFLELDKALRLLQNTTRNLGVPELFGRIEDKTKHLGEQFKFLKEEDIASSFNKLLIYGKLSENQINDLLPVVINLASATGQTLPEATSTLLKSLEGNNRGLKEFGINIKDAHTVTDRFKLIMEELKPRIDGVAEAFGGSNAGKIAASTEEFRKMKEEIGSQLAPALAGLLHWFSDIITGLEFLGTKLKETTSDFFDFFGGAQGAANHVIKQQQQYNKEVKAGAALIVDAFSDKPIKEVENEMDNVHIRLTELYRLLSLARLNKEKTFSTDDIERFKKGIDVNKEALTGLSKLLAGDRNKPIGLGNPDALSGEKKAIEDFGKDLARIQADISKANFEALKQRRQDEIDSLAAIIVDDRRSYQERYAATQVFYDKSKELIDLNEAYEISAAKVATDEEIRQVELKLGKKDLTVKQREDLNKELQLLAEKENAIELSIHQKFNSDILKLNITSEKQRTDLLEKEAKSRIDKLKREQQLREQFEKHQGPVHDIELQQIQNGYDQELSALEIKFDKGLISEKNYNKQRLLLQVNLQKSLLEADIAFTEQQIANAKEKLDFDKKILAAEIDIAAARNVLNPTEENTKAIEEARARLKDIELTDNEIISTSEKKLASLKIKLANLVADFFKKKTDQTKDDFIKMFQDISDVAKSVFDIIGGFAQASADREKNAIQDQIDLLDKKKEKDIEVANQTIINATERANAIAIIEARAAAQKEALERRKREIDQRRARFEKAANIASIIQETAIAVIRALGAKPFTPANIAMAFIVGAIGAAQLGVAIATPIPRFFKGKKKNEPYEGLGIVDDAGKAEPILRRDGHIEIGGNTPRITHVHKEDIIFTSIDKMLNYLIGSHARKMANISLVVPDNSGHFENMTNELKGELKNVTNAINRKPVLKMNASGDGLAAMWQYGANSVNYINDQTNWK